MDNILYIALSGIIIGIFISAPMGPIGMLVIQRTLNKGRKTAFYTGLGAALSDLLYCLLAGLGLSFVTDFIEDNKYVLQIIGSIVLIVYGIYLFRNNPSRTLSHAPEPSSDYWKDFVTGFLFTFSNPLILFFIIGLFARFNFMSTDYYFYNYIIGYIAIAIGALFWWWIITFSVNKVRGHFNTRSMCRINRTIASLLMVMAAVGLFHAIKNLILES